MSIDDYRLLIKDYRIRITQADAFDKNEGITYHLFLEFFKEELSVLLSKEISN